MIIRPHQNVTDVTIQGYGTLEALVQLAFENDISITQTLAVGTSISSIEYEGAKAEIVNFLKVNNIFPATALTQGQEDIANNEDPCDLCKYFK
ncbi:MAG: hypothetical protein AAF717_00370 [Bacteroidota bacterium]